MNAEKKMEWTPGPWFRSGVRSRVAGLDNHAIKAGPDEIGIAAVWFDTRTGEGLADANLIAAAPELAESMDGIVHFADALTHRTDALSVELRRWIAAGEAALAKARGEAS